jgi:integrase
MAIRTKARRLFLDFRWKGIRCREFTGLADTTENRRRLRGFDQAITGEIALGTFDYRKHFPNGTRLRDFYAEEDERVEPSNKRLVAQYLTEWHKRRSPFRPDGSVAEGADLHPSTWIHDESIIRYHLVPAFGKLRLDELTSAHCKDLGRRCRTRDGPGKQLRTFWAFCTKQWRMQSKTESSRPIRCHV